MFKTDSTLFFIHIPKTAGSSFRKAAEKYFGSQSTYFDYGEKSGETHLTIKEFDYQNKDRYAAGSFIIKHARFLSGHVPYSKYAPFFNPKNIITFLRSPEQQVRSHFEHYVRHHNYSKTFEEFITEKRFCNMQSRMLQGISPDAIGFIGLTEKYEESINLINSLFKIDLEVIKTNQNRSKANEQYPITKNEFKLIKQHNPLDFELYEYALKRFERQQKAIQNQQSFIRFGELHLPPNQAKHKFNGWVCSYENDEVQKLEVYINDDQIDIINANEYRGLPNERNLNRAGFIGFMYHYPKSIQDGDVINFVCPESRQIIYSKLYKENK